MRSVPFFNYPQAFAVREQEYLETIRRVLSGGRFILQQELEEFEQRFAAYLGVKHAFGVANGTDSIRMSLMASGLRRGDEVVLPSHTFIATASAVHDAGCVPVLVDCRDDHLIDPDGIRAAITKRTRAIVPVHLNGRTADLVTIEDIAKEHDLAIIEDAAQALGSSFGGRKAGTVGRAGSFSFYPAKVLGCYGDGGGVVTNDDDIAEQIFSLRDHGRMPDGDVRGWSFNSRLDNVQAAILDLKLTYLDGELERRRALARRYHAGLAKLDGVLLPPPPDADLRHHDVFQNYEVEVPRRDALREYLKSNGVGTIIQWGGRAVHQFPALGFDQSLPVTERVMANSLLLPMHAYLSDDDVDYVIAHVRGFYERGS